ncbi:nitrate- and nitrite sensing domain-containing protein [Kutzneria chonburiensis]|uniref:sensor histidine kinase n=1 Tax=Kutzneria chonburiensis TaxID=1483604 RepID=UPI0023614C63|nr:nitrate- and nitrite sensing domain-containing protein [Kutzneria chonburiensis]
MLLVPTVAALLLGGLRVQSEIDNANNFHRTVAQVDVARQITEVVHQLQKERVLMVTGAAATSSAAGSPLATQLDRTNGAIAELRTAVAKLNLPDAGAMDRYNRAVDGLSTLTTLRVLAQRGVYPDNALFIEYTSVIDTLVQVGREVTAAAGTQELSRASTAAQTLNSAKEQIAQLDALLQIAAAHNSFQSSLNQDRARSSNAAFTASVTDFTAVATSQERQSFSDGYSGADVDSDHLIEQSALLTPSPTAPLNIDIGSFTAASTSANDKFHQVELGLIGQLRAQASGLAGDAAAAAGRDIAALLGTLMIALGLMLVMAWSLLTPLRRLRLEALDIANVRLPQTLRRILADPEPMEAAKNAVDPVSVFSREEIGQLARSFDLVHDQAVRMAVDQAVLRDNVNAIFVNLSRRSQALVERQLSELDRLEQNEQDPDQLARFFVLDHLATRMRRNSENLIILSGTGLTKALVRPLPLAELVGAAISEVEHYARVKANGLPTALVHGRAVKDLIHLIAELLDNATTYSEASTTVTIAARQLRGGQLAMQISDSGMGMTTDELDAANHKLADPPDFDVTVARRMGLYVVGRLAQRHNIKVRLRSGDFIEGGTKAVITVPADLLAPPREETDQPDTALPVRRPARLEETQPDLAAHVPIPQQNGSLFRPPAEAEPEPVPVKEPEPEPTTRLPIYEEVLSRWFQPTEMPVELDEWPVDEPDAPPLPALPAATAEPVVEPPVNRHEAPVRSWISPADEGWLTVRTKLSGPASDQVTAVGLPKRVPNKHLVPGSAAPRTAIPDVQETRPPQFPERSPETTRSRLSGFQRGLGRARRHALDSPDDDLAETRG